MYVVLALPQTAIGEDWPMNSIAASVIGGVALTGGVGNPAGALIGAAVITIIQNIIVLFGVNSYWQSAVSGIVVVLAISFSSISTIVRENRQKRIKLTKQTDIYRTGGCFAILPVLNLKRRNVNEIRIKSFVCSKTLVGSS